MTKKNKDKNKKTIGQEVKEVLYRLADISDSDYEVPEAYEDIQKIMQARWDQYLKTKIKKVVILNKLTGKGWNCVIDRDPKKDPNTAFVHIYDSENNDFFDEKFDFDNCAIRLHGFYKWDSVSVDIHTDLEGREIQPPFAEHYISLGGLVEFRDKKSDENEKQ